MISLKKISKSHTIDTGSFVLENQGLIEFMVNKYIKSGAFLNHEREDVIQTINEELLLKEEKIRQQFKGVSSFKSYLCSIVQNICYDTIKKRKRIADSCIDTFVIHDDFTSLASNQIIIQQEIKKLSHILELYFKQKNKLILCLKIKFRVPVTIDDFQKCFHNISNDEFEKFVDDIEPYLESTDLKIFNILICIFNKYENKQNTSDSIRKWINLKTNELIIFLNGNPPTSYYSEDTFQILFEKYCNNINPDVPSFDSKVSYDCQYQ